jgi:hypothetical protein
VHDALRVRRLQRVGNLDSQLEQFLGRERFSHQAVLERLPFQILHHDEQLAVMLPNVVHRADVWMVQRRGSARLAAEAFEELAVVGEFRGQELERHRAAKLGVLGLVDHTHAPATQLLQNAVVRDGRADHGETACERCESELRLPPS